MDFEIEISADIFAATVNEVSPRKEKIKQIALANGFKLKEQPDGSMDLNPYVYDFAEALLRELDKS